MNEDPNEDLRRLLHTWEVSPTPNPDFAAAVWRRIDAEEANAAPGFWARLREWLFVQLPKPAYAAGVLAATILVSIGAANLHADYARARARLESARQYLASIDPLAMAANDSRDSH